jgi:hypothetical protein
MSERHIERIAESLSHYQPLTFAYNAVYKTFKIGKDEVALEKYGEYVAEPAKPITYEHALEFIDNSTLLFNVFDTHF